MKRNIILHGIVALVLVFGFTFIAGSSEVYAQSGSGGSYCSAGWDNTGFRSLGDVVRFVTCFILRLLVPLIFAVAFLTFLVGMLKFLRSDKPNDRTEGRQYMIWAVIALTVMAGIWGLVAIVGGTFDIKPELPQLPSS